MPHVCPAPCTHVRDAQRSGFGVRAVRTRARSEKERRDREGTEAGANGKKRSSKGGGLGAPGCERESEKREKDSGEEEFTEGRGRGGCCGTDGEE